MIDRGIDMGLISHGPRYNHPNRVEQNNMIWRDNMSYEIVAILNFYCVVEDILADRISSKGEVMSVLKTSLLMTLKRTKQIRIWSTDMRDTTFMLFELCENIENTIKEKNSWGKNEVLKVLKDSLIKTLKNEVARNQKEN